jgi:hypothetical protein
LLNLCQRLSGSMALLNGDRVAHVIRAKHDKVPACFATAKITASRCSIWQVQVSRTIAADRRRIPPGRAGLTDRAR